MLGYLFQAGEAAGLGGAHGQVNGAVDAIRLDHDQHMALLSLSGGLAGPCGLTMDLHGGTPTAAPGQFHRLRIEGLGRWRKQRGLRLLRRFQDCLPRAQAQGIIPGGRSCPGSTCIQWGGASSESRAYIRPTQASPAGEALRVWR